MPPSLSPSFSKLQAMSQTGTFPRWLLHRKDFVQLVAEYEINPAHQALKRNPDSRSAADVSHIRNWLRTIDYFSYFSEHKMNAYAKAAVQRVCKAGEVVYDLEEEEEEVLP